MCRSIQKYWFNNIKKIYTNISLWCKIVKNQARNTQSIKLEIMPTSKTLINLNFTLHNLILRYRNPLIKNCKEMQYEQ